MAFENRILEEFNSLLSQVCAHTSLAAKRPLLWTIIVNPKAGGFTIKSRWNKHREQLLESLEKASKNPLHKKAGPSATALIENGKGNGLVLTRGKGHAAKITEALVEEAASEKKGRPFHLVITAGGDGTSLEVMTALSRAPDEVRREFAILRLPMGTGNDGADAWELSKALNLIIEPSEQGFQRALKLITASGKGPFFAFNILSVGLDAYVTHMTNKMKGKLPGDSYKLWVNIGALFYDLFYKVGNIDVRSLYEGKEVMAFRDKLLLLAVGESGQRSYGSRKWILPDERNVCAIKQTSIFRRIAIGGLFTYGTHIAEPEVKLWNTDSVELSCEYPILAQMDGETILLEQNDFPAKIELTEPIIPILIKP